MLKKVGTPEQILEIASNEKEFIELKSKVEQANELVRCISCDKLLAKKQGETLDIKRKDLNVVVNAGRTIIQCPVCQTKNKL